MSRTLTIRRGGTTQYTPGWHTLTIKNAKYGKFEESRFIDVWFNDFPDTFKLRMSKKIGNDGEEFAIGQLFRFANAGITEALEGEGSNIIVKINDEADELKGNEINAYFYKDDKGYTSILPQVAPVTFSNVVEEFNEDDVTYWKNKAEAYFQNYVFPKLNGTSLDSTTNGTVASTEEPIPF